MKKTKKLLAILLAMAVLTGVLMCAAYADEEDEPELLYSGTYNGGMWGIYDDGTLFISGEGKITSRGLWDHHKPLVKTIMFDEGITGIGDDLFSGFENLEYVLLPTTMSEFSPYNFNFCDNLAAYIVGEGSEYYANDGYGLLYTKDMETLVRVPSGTEYCEVPESVKRVGDYAFYACWNLDEVIFLGQRPEFGKDSFLYVEGLTALYYIDETWDGIQIGGVDWIGILGSGSCGEDTVWMATTDGMLEIYGNGAMSDFSAENPAPWHGLSDTVTSVIVYDGVTYIGDLAFEGLSGLGGVTVSATVEKIGKTPFVGCSNLSQILFTGEKPEMDADVFTGTGEVIVNFYTSRESWNGIREQEFTGAGVTWLGIIASQFDSDNIFWILTDDGSMVVTGEGDMPSFYDDGSAWQPYKELIKSLEFDDDIYQIGAEAFKDCVNLEYVKLGRSNWKLSDSAFEGCTSLEKVDGLEHVSDLGEAVFKNCESLKSVKLGSAIEFLRNDAFKGCKSLETVTLPSMLKEIWNNVFQGCESLKRIDIPTNVTWIGTYAFADCTSLTEINFRCAKPMFIFIEDGGTPTAFDGVTAAATYPEGDASWDGIEHVDFGENTHITWNGKAYAPIDLHIKGDVNGDNEVDNRDLVIVARHLVGFTLEDVLLYADMDDSGEVNNADLVLLARILVGLA